MNQPIRIGTRQSPLAMWQALEVERLINEQGYETQIIPIKSHGDINLTQPLYQMNIVGVFTKDLDIALLNNQIDIAVHSLKDIPTMLPEGIVLSAVLGRDYEADVLVKNPHKEYKEYIYDNLFIGTGSLRRRAFWKAQYPNVRFDNIRGNVQKRLEKLESEGFDGTIFSLAGLKRLNLPLKHEVLDFIIPAPGQGVVGITSLESNEKINKMLGGINNQMTEICVTIERDFLRILEGGCTAPIGAIARVKGDTIHFVAGVISLDGTKKVYINEMFPIIAHRGKGEEFANQAIEQGAKEIIDEIKMNK